MPEMSSDKEQERKLDTMAWDLTERLGDVFDLPQDLDGPIDGKQWQEKWEALSSVMDSYMCGIDQEVPNA